MEEEGGGGLRLSFDSCDYNSELPDKKNSSSLSALDSLESDDPEDNHQNEEKNISKKVDTLAELDKYHNPQSNVSYEKHRQTDYSPNNIDLDNYPFFQNPDNQLKVPKSKDPAHKSYKIDIQGAPKESNALKNLNSGQQKQNITREQNGQTLLAPQGQLDSPSSLLSNNGPYQTLDVEGSYLSGFSDYSELDSPNAAQMKEALLVRMLDEQLILCADNPGSDKIALLAKVKLNEIQMLIQKGRECGFGAEITMDRINQLRSSSAISSREKQRVIEGNKSTMNRIDMEADFIPANQLQKETDPQNIDKNKSENRREV